MDAGCARRRGLLPAGGRADGVDQARERPRGGHGRAPGGVAATRRRRHREREGGDHLQWTGCARRTGEGAAGPVARGGGPPHRGIEGPQHPREDGVRAAGGGRRPDPRGDAGRRPDPAAGHPRGLLRGGREGGAGDGRHAAAIRASAPAVAAARSGDRDRPGPRRPRRRADDRSGRRAGGPVQGLVVGTSGPTWRCRAARHAGRQSERGAHGAARSSRGGSRSAGPTRPWTPRGRTGRGTRRRTRRPPRPPPPPAPSAGRGRPSPGRRRRPAPGR